jgi:phosphopantetheinyl transferase
VSAGTATPLLVAVSAGELDGLLGAPGCRAEAWLSAAERARLHGLRLPARRQQWLAGRLAAKQVVCRRLGLAGPEAWPEVEIVPTAQGPRRGQPTYVHAGAPGTFGLSIAHAGGTAVAALADHGFDVGVDLEPPLAFDPVGESLLLTAHETRRLDGLRGESRRRALTWIWVLKEALAKALGAGLRLRLPEVEVRFGIPQTADLTPGCVRAQTFLIGQAQAAWVTVPAARA